MSRERFLIEDDAKVSDEIRRVVNNGFYDDHPFKLLSEQLEGMISIYNELRDLEKKEFLYCLHSIKDMAEDCHLCAPCYGKGLAYIKCLTAGMDEDESREAAEKYEKFALRVGDRADYERDLKKKAAHLGVEI